MIHSKRSFLLLVLVIGGAGLFLFSCAKNIRYTASTLTPTTVTSDQAEALALTGVKVRFYYDDLYNLSNPAGLAANYCVGGVKTFRNPYSSEALPSDGNGGTIRPQFIRDVSVDLTDANSVADSNTTANCAASTAYTNTQASKCSIFDHQFVDASNAPIGMGKEYNTGYYTVLDTQCQGKGPLNTSIDPLLNRLYAGGIYFDLERSEFGENENLLLDLLFYPFGPANNDAAGVALTKTDEAVIQVHLVKTGLTYDLLSLMIQPRFLQYFATAQYPTLVQSLSIISPPTGQMRHEQIFIPLAFNSSVDRIRVERLSGSGVFLEASLYKTGNK